MGRTYQRLISTLHDAEQQGAFVTPAYPEIAHSLRRAYKAGIVVRPMPQVYARAERWEELKPKDRARHIVKALAYAHPEWVFAGPSAALFHGLSVSYRAIRDVHVAAIDGWRPHETTGYVRHSIKGDVPTVVDGVRVTSFLRTTFDCVCRENFRRGLAVADSALRVTGMDRNGLQRDLSTRFVRHRGVRRVREVMAHADGRSANGGESIARAAMIELGYLLPDLQHRVTDPVDGSEYFADFFWELPDVDVVGELDGRDKYVEPAMTEGRSTLDVMTDERLRESRISARRVMVMRLSYADITNDERLCCIMDAYGIPRDGVPGEYW